MPKPKKPKQQEATSERVQPAGRKQTNKREPSFEEIQRRAYSIYESRAGGPGSPAQDWLEAERELCDRPIVLGG